MLAFRVLHQAIDTTEAADPDTSCRQLRIADPPSQRGNHIEAC
jgi:hypothetical protein